MSNKLGNNVENPINPKQLIIIVIIVTLDHASDFIIKYIGINIKTD